MRTFRVYLFVPACLFITAATAFSQITITRSDFLNAMQVGNTGTGYTTPPGSKVPVNVGTASTTEQVWDFRALTYTKQSDGVVIDAATAPHKADFPAANIVYKLTLVGATGIMYQYQQVTTNQYLLHGLGYSDATPLYRYTPPAVQMTFPCTRGTTWVYVADPTSPVPGVTIQNTFTWTCDAFGTLRLPHGDFPALRLITETVTQSTTPVGSSLMRSYRYNFVTRTLTGASVSFDSTDRGKATVSGTVGYTAHGSGTDVNGIPQPDDIALSSPFPLPCRDVLTVPIVSSRETIASLQLCDALGRTVLPVRSVEISKETTYVPVGVHGIVPGVYHLDVQVAGVTLRRTIVVAR